MKFHFDAALSYQKTAIDAVTQVFDGQPLAESGLSISLSSSTVMGMAHTELGLGNRLALDDGTADGEARIEQWLHANVKKMQLANQLPQDASLQGRHFSIEMETGTGKTYVYLRSIFELNKLYGFCKFIIVVPSVPIREGALASIKQMREHFTALYGVPFDAVLYDSKNLSKVRQFATANTIQIMVMNIQSFQKDVKDDEDIATMTAEQLKKLNVKVNVINRESDMLSGHKPISFIQATRPIVIIDEPQSVEGDTRQGATLSSRAIDRLHSLCTLRYSATHRNPHNLLYKLDPIAAYDQRLVKRIEVASARADANLNDAYVQLIEVDNKKTLRARVRINVAEESADGVKVKQKAIWVKAGDDLWLKSKNRQEYRNGYIVQSINFEAGAEHLRFASGVSLKLGQALGGMDDDLLKLQIRATVELHLKKEREVRGKGIKVLSLFFIDVVANYRMYHDDGTTGLGKLGIWFEEAYAELTAREEYRGLLTDPVEKVHNGYFSKDKKGGYKDTSGGTRDDEDTYSLIMSKKEELLELSNPLRFIFSHTALREGWDNPNVFQICVLREIGSETERRQTIGRGLRLPVDQNGDRIHDAGINRLTVIAQESYESFADNLQKEYERDLDMKFGVVTVEAFAKLVELPEQAKILHQHLQQHGYLDAAGLIQPKFDPSYLHFELNLPPEFAPLRAQVVDLMQGFVFKNRIGNARNRGPVKLRKSMLLDPTFKALWAQISQHTRYRVSFSTEELINTVVGKIQELPPILPLQMHLERVGLQLTQAGIATSGIMQSEITYANAPQSLPDILAYLQNETDLTRQTLAEILQRSGRLHEFRLNPQAFITQAASQINHTLHALMLRGIEYLKIAGQQWEMHRLENSAEQQLERYLDNLYKVNHQGKALFDYVEYQSETEKKFAQELDDDERVKFFVKLPGWFKVDTPVGPYNPDWAIVFEQGVQQRSRLYLVRETKSTQLKEKLRQEENDKILCGGKHFAAIGVDYAVATSMRDVVQDLTARAML